jgi:hypothetical protein
LGKGSGNGALSLQRKMGSTGKAGLKVSPIPHKLLPRDFAKMSAGKESGLAAAPTEYRLIAADQQMEV